MSTITITLTLPLDKARLLLDLLDEPQALPDSKPERADVLYRVTPVDDDEEEEEEEEDDGTVTGAITPKMIEEAELCRSWREKHRFFQYEAAQYFSPDEDGHDIPASSWCFFENPEHHPNMVSPEGKKRRDRRRLDYIVHRLRNLRK